MGDSCVAEKLHLFFRGAHEDEAGGDEEEGREVLEAVDFLVDIRRVEWGGAISQHKGDLDETSHSCGHEGVAEDAMDVGAELEVLRVRRHAPAREQNDAGRDEVAAGATSAVTGQPKAHEARSPPDDAHASVLQVVADPWAAPAVLSKGVDAAPEGNDKAVPEFLAAACTRKPSLAAKEEKGKDDAVADERRTHDKMRQALPEVVALTEAL